MTRETIYQALYVQGCGELRRELARAFRTGSSVMISERPAEVGDHAVAGHWESDLILGKDATPLVDTMAHLPNHLHRSLTWDRGGESRRHHEFALATGLPVYFCDPHSPWQPGSNENTNSLLRQYFPKDTDLAVHTSDHLDAVAVELNGRPRKTLDWDTPAERLAALLAAN